MTNQLALKPRVLSIDVLRGIIMVLMALDHVRDFFFKASLKSAGSVAMDPTNMATTTPGLFFTRWITHFCAPVFVFLAGTSIFLISRKKSKKELSQFLIKRGCWLLFVEIAVISLAWTLNPFYNVIILQVIWAIGISMIVIGLLVYLPAKFLLALGLIIVLGHNCLQYPSFASLKGNIWFDLLYFTNFSTYNIFQNHMVLIVYSFLPWTGVMLLGFYFGKLYDADMEAFRRRKILIVLGSAIIALFFLLRIINIYGDPLPWSAQPRGAIYTVLSFLNTNKYPPSLEYLCMTLGPAMLMLAFLEKIQNRFISILNIFGRVPMFYYILHLYLIHLIGVIVFYASGFSSKDIITPASPFYFRPPGLGFSLVGVYIIWIIVVLVLFPLCKWYNRYKSTHKSWWLSYL
jgi:uncharacterized membrane protein